MLVRIIKDWGYPENLDFFGQTPDSEGVWDGIQFTEEEVSESDYLIVFKNPKRDIEAICREGGLWLISHEPPIWRNEYFMKSFKYFDKVFSYYRSQEILTSSTHPLIPWMVLRSYNELSSINISDAKFSKLHEDVVWITSNQRNLSGQVLRMNFKDFLMEKGLNLRLFGKGFQEVNDKFDSLFPSRYALAIENFCHKDYWSEKIVDSLLSFCLPFYWGAPNLEEFLPEKSFVRIDITKPKEALQIILTTMSNNEWEKRLEYIDEARKLILSKYQFFPSLSGLIKEDIAYRPLGKMRKRIIPKNPIPNYIKISDQLGYYRRRLYKIFK